MKRTILLLILGLISMNGFAQKGKEAALPKLTFKEGDAYSVKSVEMLRIRMQFSQVDSALVDPSTRVTTYFFTENITKVYPDGSADFATSVDSFTTKIYVGEVKETNEYFRFDSKNEFDIMNRLKDIRAIPRAQFLGQTLKYRVGNDGRILSFENLNSFREGAISRAFEYDVTQAMLSLSDSLRVGQLLEHGSGVLAGNISLPYTVTEIHVDRTTLASTSTKGRIDFKGTFTNPPATLEYLEGIAFPMSLADFQGGTRGSMKLTNGYVNSSEVTDSASMVITIDAEIIKNDLRRTYYIERKPLQVLKGGTVRIQDRESHKAEYKEPEEKPNDLEINVNVDTGEIETKKSVPSNPTDSLPHK
jgi:hypothetical protein